MENMVDTPGPSASRGKPRHAEASKILVTGAEGYIGYILSSRLLKRGYDITGLDTGFYNRGFLYNDGSDRPRMLRRDTRRVSVEELRGFDAVIHLAELSNDPLCEFDERTTYDINFKGSVALAEKAKRAGVRRFIYSSSCSTYGASGDAERTETSSVDPQTAYARCKILVEHGVSALADSGFTPTFLRNATAFGASPRMRFDIVLNNLAGLAWTTHCIRMTSDGTPWRPLVHVEDICDAIVACLEAPKEAIANEIFNVGDDNQNYRVRDIVDTVATVFPGCTVSVGSNNGDNRSYRVSFQKIRKHLPDFRCRWGIERGAEQLRGIFEKIELTEETFKAVPFTRLLQLKQLVRTNQVDDSLHWRGHDLS
jgi:nucleoside-diphosphate-sugar epimerase